MLKVSDCSHQSQSTFGTPAVPQDAKVTELFLHCALLPFLFLWLTLARSLARSPCFPLFLTECTSCRGLIIRKAAGMAQFADTEAAVLYSTVISVRPALNNCQATGREPREVRVASHFGSDCKVNFQVLFPSSLEFIWFWLEVKTAALVPLTGLVGNCSSLCQIQTKSCCLHVSIAFLIQETLCLLLVARILHKLLRIWRLLLAF